MKHVRCPETFTPNGTSSVFLAGGISNCWDWQTYIKTLVNDRGLNVTLFDPRREGFNASNPAMNVEQITWEREYLTKADIILFWFPNETLCPITLFELGFWLNSNKPLIVGTDLEYKRREDVIIQVGLSRPGQFIYTEIEHLVDDLEVMI
jgi:hypothetical protein